MKWPPFGRLERLLIGLNIVALLISGVAGVIVARGVTRPVIELSQGVRRIIKGDYSVRVPGENTRTNLAIWPRRSTAWR